MANYISNKKILNAWEKYISPLRGMTQKYDRANVF